jgi:spermidine/putrescine transport system permease protein
MILVYIPMLTDFVTSDIVGGTGSYMMGQRVRDLILGQGDWGAGSALNFLLLAMAVLLSLGAYRLAKLNRIEA